MWGRDRFRLPSLRLKLGAAAFAGLITTAALTLILLLTAWTASDVVNTARLTHERVHVYTQLQTAAHEYQVGGYRKVREPGPDNDLKAEQSRAKLSALLAQVSRMQTSTAREASVKQRVLRQGRTVLNHYRNPAHLVGQVDAKWREGGSRAALLEVNRISAPIFAIEETLQNEIQYGGRQVARATERAQWLVEIAVVASLLGLVLAVTFSLVVHMLLHARLRPGLTRLERGAQAFGSGDLDHRIDFPGADELSRLGFAFNRMAATIAEKQAALREVQLGLERAVMARTQELQRANAMLSASDERRRAFLADVSHELRTPITVIRGEAQVAMRTAEQPDFDSQEVFERILQQTRDLSRMVDDLFLIARAEAGGLPLECRMLDLHDIATRVAGDFGTLASESGGSIRALPPDEEILALVDPDRVRRALASLIENALRHCQPGVNVEIEVYATDSAAVIAVSDDGPGIDPALAPYLFERFRRGETRGEGSGLGLSLVSALVEAHGGRAYLKAGRNGGTQAVLEFPVAACAKVAA